MTDNKANTLKARRARVRAVPILIYQEESQGEEKEQDEVITLTNSNNINSSGMIAIDLTCTNVAGKKKEFSNAGDAVVA